MHSIAPANVKKLAGEPTRLFRSEKDDDVRYILRLSDAAEWDRFGYG